MSLPSRLPAAGWMREPETVELVTALANAGVAVRFVGGCVRDTLLGRAVTDIDLATPETPERMMAALADAGIRAIPTGIAHGTITAVIGPRHFEITTLRRDVETDGRHAKVAFTDDWTEDAARRDFTINALSADPDGTLHDPFGGLADLDARRVRFVGDAEQRIREDVLRLLRFFRFEANYGTGSPDANGLAACRKLAPLVPALSGERIAGEIIKLLRAENPVSVLRLMIADAILRSILPQIADVDRLAALIAIEIANDRPDAIRRLAALLPADPSAADAVSTRLRLSNAEAARLAVMAAPEIAVTSSMLAPSRRRAQRRVGTATFCDLILLSWSGQVARGARDESFAALLAEARAWEPPDFPLKGRDVLDLGIARGPQVGRMLAAVERWWEDGDYLADRPACLERLRELAASPDSD